MDEAQSRDPVTLSCVSRNLPVSKWVSLGVLPIFQKTFQWPELLGMNWRPGQGVHPIRAQCSWDSLQIHYHPDQDKAVTHYE